MKHMRSKEYIQCEKVSHVTKQIENNEATPIVGGICNMEKAIELRLTKLFRTAYYLAEKERPFTGFAGLIQLQNCNGADLGTTYMNDKAAQSFISSIAGVYFDEPKHILAECDFFSVLVDGSTDKSDIEEELIFVRIIEDGYPTMAYLKIVDLQHANADGIVAALDQAFEQFGFDPISRKKSW